MVLMAFQPVTLKGAKSPRVQINLIFNWAFNIFYCLLFGSFLFKSEWNGYDGISTSYTERGLVSPIPRVQINLIFNGIVLSPILKHTFTISHLLIFTLKTYRTKRFFASEIIRAALFRNLGKELPYCCEGMWLF